MREIIRDIGKGYNLSKEYVINVARYAANAALTSPKSGGVDQIECELVYGDDLEILAKKMEEISCNLKGTLKRIFKTEAVMVRESAVALIIGNYRAADTPLDAGCGFCGGKADCTFVYERRPTLAGQIDLTEIPPSEKERLPFYGPFCCVRTLDLGFATGSALLIAQRFLIDAVPMYSVGLAAHKLGYCPDSWITTGILMSSLQKNPYVDVLPDYHLHSWDRMLSDLRKIYIILRGIYWYDYKTWYPKNDTPEQEEKDGNN